MGEARTSYVNRRCHVNTSGTRMEKKRINKEKTKNKKQNPQKPTNNLLPLKEKKKEKKKNQT